MTPELTQPVRTIFAGTPDFAVPALKCLIAHPAVEMVAVYTQPDRPAGRGRRLTPSPVKRVASDAAIAVYQPPSLKDGGAIETFCKLDAALLVVAAYGLILPRAVIEQPRLSINVHASLLPRWRGAAPIQRAIMAGDEQTGITMMRVVEALDAGPIVAQSSCPINPADTAGEVHERLAALGADLLHTTIEDLLRRPLREREQDENLISYAEKITSGERQLAWAQDAVSLERRVRALNPVPVATTLIAEDTVKIWSALALSKSTDRMPGSLVAATERGIDVATGNGILRITELQPPGKRRMSAAAFINGFRPMLDAAAGVFR